MDNEVESTPASAATNGTGPHTADAPKTRRKKATTATATVAAAAPAAPPASVPVQPANGSESAATILEDERRKSADAQAALDDLRKQLAAAQATLAADLRRVTEATSAPPRPAAPAADAPVSKETAPANENMFGILPLVGVRGADILAVGRQVAGMAVSSPPRVFQHSLNFLLEMGRVVTGNSAAAPAANDKRFADPLWQTNPFYQRLLQAYVVWRDSLNAFIDESDLDPKDAARARFVLSLLTDTMAPTNTLLGNPAAMKKAFETGGESLVKGFVHWLDDMANNGGLPAQVDMKAFKVGKDLAITPGAVVFKNDVFELIQYQPSTPQVYSRPLVVVPPQVNKYYAMDLSPSKSIVRYLVAQGQQVFAISWRNPTKDHRDWGFDVYDRAILQAVDVARSIADSSDVNISASCLGGMTLASVLGHLAAGGDKRINAITFMVTVLDSTVESTMGLFAGPDTIAAARQASQSKGVVDGSELARAFAWLRPNDLIWSYWVNNYLLGNDPAAFDVLFWNNDTTRLPAKLHGDMLDVLEHNGFAQPGTIKALGTPVDLSKVTQDAYIVAGITDHITPWQGCYSTTQLLGGKARFVLSNSGHIQALLNPPGNPKSSYFFNETLPTSAEQWLSGAEKRPGSWWDDWATWLAERGDEQKPAPEKLGNKQYPAGVAAPGTYIFEP